MAFGRKKSCTYWPSI